MTETWTVGRLQKWATEYLQGYGVESPRLSVDLLLGRVLGLDRVQVYLRFEQPLRPEELAAFKALLIRRREREPVAYILGEKEFFGLGLAVGPGVLIPRPETEHLVEEALARLQKISAPRVLDLCTGSGAVALAIAENKPDALLTAVDVSADALSFASQNAQALGLADRVRLLHGSLFAPVSAAGGFFDMITANPPYVSEPEMACLPEAVKRYEPALALCGGPLGLDLMRDIVLGARAHLKPFGWLLVEMGASQGEAAKRLAQGAGIYDDIAVLPDLAGLDRVLVCQRGDYG